MDTLHCCPACGQPDTLILLGSRDDHPHRWRWWSTAITLLYLCEQCDELLEVGAAPEPRRSPRRIASVLRPPCVRGQRGQDRTQWGAWLAVNESRHGRHRRR